MITKKQVEEIKRVGFFDFLTSNAHFLNKSDIVTLAREFNCAVYELDKELESQAIDKMLENMEGLIED